MAKKTVETPVEPQTEDPKVGLSELAEALVTAIEIARPKKITPANRKRKGSPWLPKDGTPKLKLRRKMYHHSLPIESRLTNEEITLLNKIKPGNYCDNWVSVTKRRDKGINIDYRIKTNAQRLKFANMFAIHSFVELLNRIVDEGENPRKYKDVDDVLDTDE